MLSQIESGTAMPSVKTLEYLCRVLDISLSASDLNAETPGKSYAEIRRLFDSGDHKAVTEAECSDPLDDELSALKALSFLALARQADESGEIADKQSAVELSGRAIELSRKGIFANPATEESANAIRAHAAAVLADYYKALV